MTACKNAGPIRVGTRKHATMNPAPNTVGHSCSQSITMRSAPSAPAARFEVRHISIRAPRKIALFDCAHWMRERHAGFVARDRNGSAWLFDLYERYRSLDAKKYLLVFLNEVVPWEIFLARLSAVWRKPDEERKNAAGRKPWDENVIFQ